MATGFYDIKNNFNERYKMILPKLILFKELIVLLLAFAGLISCRMI